MNNELPLYQGAMPQAAQQQFAQVPQMPRLQMYGEQLDGAIAAGLDAVDKYADLHDFGVRQETEHKLRQNELEMQQEFERKSRLAPGAEGSFFTAEGNLNEDAVAVFTDKWQQRNREVARPYWKREGAMRGEEQVLAQNDRLAGNVGLGLMKMESQHRQQAFKDNYDLAVAQGDTAGACRIVDDAVASGQVTEARGRIMKLGLVKRSARAAGGRARSGGRETSAQFLDNFYDGFDEETEPSEEENAGKAELDGAVTGEEPSLTETKVQETSTDGGSLPAVNLLDFTTGTDYEGLLGSKPVLDLGLSGLNDDEWKVEFGDTLDVSGQGTIRLTGDALQPVSFEAGETAPEAVQAHMGKAQARKGMRLEELRRMCYSVAGQMVESPDYKGLSDADMKKAIVGKITVPGAEDMFFADAEDPGLAAQSFFDGIVSNVMSTRDSNLGAGVDGVLKGRDAKAAIERAVKGIDPVVVMQLYPDMTKYADAGREHWWRHDKENDSARALEPAFQRHKERFFAETGAEPQEWSTLSSKFAEWYLGKGGGYESDQKAYVDAVREVCRTAATDAVVAYRRGGGDNWAEEQELIRSTVADTLKGLRQDDVDVYVRFNAERDKRLRERAKVARERWDSDSAALQAEVSAGAEAKRKKEEDAKAAEEKAKAKAKAEEAEAERLVHPYRAPVVREVKLAGKGLRGSVATDDPAVYVPRKMYDEISYDVGATGGGVVCRFGMGKKRFLVLPSDGSEAVELNAAAHMSLYGERMRKSREAAARYARSHAEEIRFEKL